MASSDKDRDELRKVRRASEETTDPAKLPASEKPAARPVNDCDPTPSPVVETFSEPDKCTIVLPPAVSIPDPLELGNLEYTASCTPPAVGSSVTATADQFIEKLFWQNVPDITDNQLNYIATLAVGDITTIKTRGTAAAVIKSLTKLTDAQVSYIVDEKVVLYALADDTAVNWADGGLACLYGNTEIVEYCDDNPAGDAYTDGDDGSTNDLLTLPASQQNYVDNPVVIPADTYFSSVDQTDANNIATEVAVASLRCLYGNTAQTACCAIGDCANDIGYTESVPVDVTPVTPSGELRVGTYTVAADTIFSFVSQADANALALLAAEAALNCFYPSDAVTNSCEDYNCGTAWTAPGTVAVGDVFTNGGTCYMAVAAQDPTATAPGTLSINNTAHATWIKGTAYVSSNVVFYADAYWICNGNHTATYANRPGVGSEWDQAMWIVYEVDSPTAISDGISGSEVSLAQGWFILEGATDTVAAATALATSLSVSLLDCWWENDERLGNCANAEITFLDSNGESQTLTPDADASAPATSTVSAGEVRSYVSQLDADSTAQDTADGLLLCYYCNNEVPPYCLPDGYVVVSVPIDCSQDRTDWSVSATPGVAAGTVCSLDGPSAQNTANSVGKITCEDLQTSEVNDNCCYESNEVTGECVIPPSGCLDPTLPYDNGPVVLPPGTVTLCSSGASQALADAAAQDIANAMMLCWWENVEVTDTCTDPAPNATHDEPGEPDSMPAPGNSGCLVEAGTIISFSSQCEADTLATTICSAQMLCSWCNHTINECFSYISYDGGGEPIEPALTEDLADCTVISQVSTTDADQQAAALCAKFGNASGNGNIPGGPGGGGADGLPGNDGGQTGCDGTCYGYYSPDPI